MHENIDARRSFHSAVTLNLIIQGYKDLYSVFTCPIIYFYYFTSMLLGACSARVHSKTLFHKCKTDIRQTGLLTVVTESKLLGFNYNEHWHLS